MADNIQVTSGSGNTVAADDVSGVLHQRVKLVLGTDGVSDGDVSSTNPIPAALTASQIATLTPLIDRILSTAPYSNRLSDGTVFYDARSIRTLTSSDQITVANTSFPVTNALETASTGTITSPTNAITSFSVLASNANRKGFVIHNDSTTTVFIAFAATASSTAFTVRLTSQASYISNSLPIYRGIISGIAVAANGNLRVTELT
jgi:hypothetical protein